MRLLDFAARLRRNPWRSVKALAVMCECDTSHVERLLGELEVVEKRGSDPLNGRANVRLFAIELPAEKRKALK